MELVDKEHQRNGSKIGRTKRLFDKIHLLGVWVIGAQTQGARKGMVDMKTLEAFRRGEFFEVIRERRRDRGDVLPLWKAGPIS